MVSAYILYGSRAPLVRCLRCVKNMANTQSKEQEE